MLGKLMKQEWLSTWKIPTVLIGVVFAAATIFGLFCASPVWDLMDWWGADVIFSATILLFYGALMCCGVGTSIYLAVRYYRSMYSNEGYLTHTLPVTPNQLLLSKMINFSIWELLSVICIVFNIMLFAAFIVLREVGYRSLFESFQEVLMEMQDILNSEYATGWELFMVLTIILILVGTVSKSLLYMGSVNIGQLWARHRVAGAILVYGSYRCSADCNTGSHDYLYDQCRADWIAARRLFFQLLKPGHGSIASDAACDRSCDVCGQSADP